MWSCCLCVGEQLAASLFRHSVKMKTTSAVESWTTSSRECLEGKEETVVMAWGSRQIKQEKLLTGKACVLRSFTCTHLVNFDLASLPPELEDNEKLKNIEPRMVELILNEVS